MIRHRKIRNAVDDKRRGFHRCLARLERPGHRQRPDVGRVDLLERTEALARVVAVERRPVLRWPLQQHSGVDTLRQQAGGHREAEQPLHRSVTRYANTLCTSAFVYFDSSSRCLASRSVVSTLTELDGHDRCTPSAVLMVTSNASCCSNSPVNCFPAASVTVASCRTPAGYMKRACNSTGGYLVAMPLRSPVGEWHVAHCPAPLK